MSTHAKGQEMEGAHSHSPWASPQSKSATCGKSYGDFEAVRGISFSVEPGEVFGLLGPNGAGKTTTVEILEGYRQRGHRSPPRCLGRTPDIPRTNCASGSASSCNRAASTRV